MAAQGDGHNSPPVARKGPPVGEDQQHQRYRQRWYREIESRACHGVQDAPGNPVRADAGLQASQNQEEAEGQAQPA